MGLLYVPEHVEGKLIIDPWHPRARGASDDSSLGIRCRTAEYSTVVDKVSDTGRSRAETCSHEPWVGPAVDSARFPRYCSTHPLDSARSTEMSDATY